jgi:ComF family protein
MERLKNCVRGFADRVRWARIIETVCVFPCPGCREALPEQGWNGFCTECLSRLHRIDGPRCPGCGGPQDGILAYCSKCLRIGVRPWKDAYAVIELDPFGLELIHRYKYSGQVELARAFAALGAETIRRSGTVFDAIVPVPLHWTRYLGRGFNQAHLFCRLLGGELGIPVRGYLVRSRATRRQARLNREQRLNNLTDAFALRRGANPDGLRLLLIDDVLTTGATLTEACRPLAKAQVSIMVIGRR